MYDIGSKIGLCGWVGSPLLRLGLINCPFHAVLLNCGPYEREEERLKKKKKETPSTIQRNEFHVILTVHEGEYEGNARGMKNLAKKKKKKGKEKIEFLRERTGKGMRWSGFMGTSLRD